MTVTELIEVLSDIPEECRNSQIIIREIHELDDYTAYLDKPIVGFWYDGEHDELCFMDNENMNKYERMNVEGVEE